VHNLKNSPNTFIEIVSKAAIENRIKTNQIVLCNEIYNVLNKQPNLSQLMAQTMGFIDIIQTEQSLLDDSHKVLILTKLKLKVQACIQIPTIHEGGRHRAIRFIRAQDE
jgi:hypothetical protein